VIIQSQTYGPVELEKRIEDCVASVDNFLTTLPNETFESFRSGLIGSKLEKDKSLRYREKCEER